MPNIFGKMPGAGVLAAATALKSRRRKALGPTNVKKTDDTPAGPPTKLGTGIDLLKSKIRSRPGRKRPMIRLTGMPKRPRTGLSGGVKRKPKTYGNV